MSKVFYSERTFLARIFHELLSRDHEDGRATWQPQGVGSEAYQNGTSQGPTPEDARKDAIFVVAASDSYNIRAKDLEKRVAESEVCQRIRWHDRCTEHKLRRFAES